MNIHFTKEWSKVIQYIEPRELQEFVLSTDNGIICSQYILREIPFAYQGKKYYNIASPYGYGGLYIGVCEDILLQQYI